MNLRHFAGAGGQWGEIGMIAEIFRRLHWKPGCVAEFGAGDDPALLNTRLWAEHGVATLLAEPDLDRQARLATQWRIPEKTMLTPDHVTNVDDWLDRWEFPCPDLLSIDVDGEDYDLFLHMEAMPMVLVIEHHPMIPAHVSFVGGPDIGCSALALVKLAEDKGYSLVGTTHCNCIFIRERDSLLFRDLDTDLDKIFDPSDVTFAVSNVKNGDYLMLGPWPFGQGKDLTCK